LSGSRRRFLNRASAGLLWLLLLRLLNLIRICLRWLRRLALLSVTASQPIRDLPAVVGLGRRQYFSLLRLSVPAGETAAQRGHPVGQTSSLGRLPPSSRNHECAQHEASDNGEPTIHDRILAIGGIANRAPGNARGRAAHKSCCCRSLSAVSIARVKAEYENFPVNEDGASREAAQLLAEMAVKSRG
jgi:hypothetical protein